MALHMTKSVGKSALRKEGRDKVTGRAKYVDDLTFAGMIHGTTVRSTVARGRITNIRYEPGIAWNEFTIVTAKDIPRLCCSRTKTVICWKRLDALYISK
jgi:CO/xanthine dehydrogenase Mo-binding subunit